jgi:PIN domain nuclease of toxin-antitoxin system
MSVISWVSRYHVGITVSSPGHSRSSIPVERWSDDVSTVSGICLIPLSLPVTTTAVRLTILADPADMRIVATTQQHGVRLVTSDARIEESKLVAVVA